MRTTKRGCDGIRLLAAAAPALAFIGCATPDGFTFADTNKDNKISPAECNRYMLEAIYAETDADGDSKVTFQEWKQTNPGAEQKKFSVPDADKDGVVTPAETKAHFERAGTLSDLFTKMDADGSGYVTRSEAIAFDARLKRQ